MKTLPIETLRQLLAYDANTGKLYWLPRNETNVAMKIKGSAARAQTWNKHYAGTEALKALGKSGYLNGAIYDQKFSAHRVAWALHYGEWPKGEIDHVNGVKTDNRIGNLRDVCRSENHRNIKRPVTNTSGVVGVSWNKREHKWVAYIRAEKGKSVFLGAFKDLAAAADARRDAERKYGFHENHGRLVLGAV